MQTTQVSTRVGICFYALSFLGLDLGNVIRQVFEFKSKLCCQLLRGASRQYHRSAAMIYDFGIFASFSRYLKRCPNNHKDPAPAHYRHFD
jgi:hypothetical protein